MTQQHNRGVETEVFLDKSETMDKIYWVSWATTDQIVEIVYGCCQRLERIGIPIHCNREGNRLSITADDWGTFELDVHRPCGAVPADNRSALAILLSLMAQKPGSTLVNNMDGTSNKALKDSFHQAISEYPEKLQQDVLTAIGIVDIRTLFKCSKHGLSTVAVGNSV